MGSVFWRFFWTLALTIAGVILVVVAISTIFGLSPPKGAAQDLIETAILDSAATVLKDSGTGALARFAAAAASFNRPVDLVVANADPADCQSGPAATAISRLVQTPDGCISITAKRMRYSIVAKILGFWPIIFAGIITSLASALWLARYLLWPLETLQSGLRSLAKGDFHVRIGKTFGHRKDEITAVGHDFDIAAAKLDDFHLSQQRLFHDVSHELRSPLSRLQAAAGILKQNPARLPDLLLRINREIDRLDGLVEEILTLAQLESGEPYQFDKQPVDLVELVNAIVEDGAFEGQAHGVILEVIGVDTAVSHVNGELIYRAIENVIRNAIKYSEPGGKVVIRTAILAGGKALQIRVEDTGPGLPDSQMEAIFRPFVRAESTGDARAGVGLGLAITRQAIELHGGSVRAHKAQPRGLIVEIIVPLTSDRPQR
jgi:hypothetical protein